ncbi:LuxR C-terminal-related transcriptional regulator [Streptomyces sp. NPDC087440]|uniref:helix-turn-helix transcriptional regulator n=1 Tax=Streptomyces sp. NPDC087440 TaxID=3365790 RepID=UPI00380CE3CF
MTPSTTARAPLRLFGRSHELAVLESLLVRGGAGRGGALVVAAPPGQGRTALLRQALADHAEHRPGTVLEATGAPCERLLPRSGLHALLCSAPGPLPIAPEQVLRSGFTATALLALLRELARTQPLVVCVDDAHCWDRDSRTALAFAARRLGADSRIVLVVSTADETEFAGLSVLRPGPLDDDAASALLDRLTDGTDGVDPCVRAELMRQAAGNPRLLAGLTACLTPGQLAGCDPLPHPLPGGESVLEAHAALLDGLSPQTRTLLLLTAAAAEHEPDGTGTDVMLLLRAGAGAGLGADLVEQTLTSPGATAGALRRAGDRVHFRHPLLRRAVLNSALPAHRRAAHALFVALLSGPGSPPLPRLVQRACAASGSDDVLAGQLARYAGEPGPHAERAAALVHAADLTTDAALRAARFAEAAEQTRLAGDPGRSRALLARLGPPAVPAAPLQHAGPFNRDDSTASGRGAGSAEGGVSGQGQASVHRTASGEGGASRRDEGHDAARDHDARVRAAHHVRVAHGAAQCVRGLLLLRDGPAADAREALLTAADLLLAHDPRRAREALLGAAEAAWATGEAPAFLDAMQRIPPATDDPALAYYGAGMCAVLDGRTAEGHTQLQRHLDTAKGPRSPEELLRAVVAALVLGDIDAACRTGARALAAVRSTGSQVLLPKAFEHLAHAELRAGRHARARAHATEGMRAARRTGQSNTAAHLHAVLALVASVEGDATVCATHCDAALAGAAPHGLVQAATLATWALARAELSHGRPAEALARLAPLVQPKPHRGHFAVRMLAVPCYVEAAVLSGRAESGPVGASHEPADCAPGARAACAASAAVAEFAQWAERTADPQAPAQLARCRALLAPPEEVCVRYEEALALHDRAGGDFERGRTQLLYGQWLRRRRRTRDARGPLRDALVSFERCSARVWAERASGELRAAGEAVGTCKTPLAVLTPQQDRIARYVAEGATNREVAVRLSVSPRTVDHHLRNVFAALGVRSRTELARLMGRQA